MAADIFSRVAWPLGMLLCFVCVGIYAYRARSYSNMVRGMCVLAFASTAFFAIGFELAADSKSFKEPAAIVRAQAGPEDIVVSYKDTAQGLSFYLGRRIVLVDNMGELMFGALQEQDPRWFIDSDALGILWKGPIRVFLISDERHIEELASLLGKSNIIELGRTQNDVVLSNF